MSCSRVLDLMAAHSGMVSGPSDASNLERIELTMLCVQSMVTTLLMVIGGLAPASVPMQSFQDPVLLASGHAAHELDPLVSPVLQTISSGTGRLRRMRAKKTRCRLWRAAVNGAEKVATVNATTNTKEAGNIIEELVPMSAVEKVVETIQQKNEEGNQKLSNDMLAVLDMKTSALQRQVADLSEEVKSKDCTIKVLQQDLQQMRAVGNNEVFNWAMSDGSESLHGEEELCANMHVQIFGLVSKPELNGLHGILVRLEGVNGDRWQVDLGAALGVKLIRPSNLRCLGKQRDAAATSGNVTDIQYHSNDM